REAAGGKNDLQLFSRMFLCYQIRGGNLQEFFRHENQACRLALSDGGRLRLRAKSDRLTSGFASN
ncbi:hypothetical protein LSAT2_015737, partial [Lamellibrachia satsuma]